MENNDSKNSVIYEKTMHWPPYTYRDYPDVTLDSMHSFFEFLETENTGKERKQLQPWIPYCSMKCNFCYFPTELISKNKMDMYLILASVGRREVYGKKPRL